VFEARIEAARAEAKDKKAQAIQQCNEKFLAYGYAAEYKALQQKTLGERAPTTKADWRPLIFFWEGGKDTTLSSQSFSAESIGWTPTVKADWKTVDVSIHGSQLYLDIFHLLRIFKFVCFTRPEFWFTEDLMLFPVDTVLVVPEFASLPVEFPEQLDSTHQTELMILTNWPKVLPGHTIYGS